MRVKCSYCISPARARLCVHGTQNPAQNPDQNRERNTDNEAVQRPLADRFGTHRRRLLEAQEQDQADHREQKRARAGEMQSLHFTRILHDAVLNFTQKCYYDL